MIRCVGQHGAFRNAAAVAKSKTIIWNGPMGVFEMASFEKGTKSATLQPVELLTDSTDVAELERAWMIAESMGSSCSRCSLLSSCSLPVLSPQRVARRDLMDKGVPPSEWPVVTVIGGGDTATAQLSAGSP